MTILSLLWAMAKRLPVIWWVRIGLAIAAPLIVWWAWHAMTSHYREEGRVAEFERGAILRLQESRAALDLLVATQVAIRTDAVDKSKARVVRVARRSSALAAALAAQEALAHEMSARPGCDLDPHWLHAVNASTAAAQSERGH